MKPTLLVVASAAKAYVESMADGYDVHYLPDVAERNAFMAANPDTIRAVLTTGTLGFSADDMAALPNLEFLACYGVGVDTVDLAAARARGITLTHGPGTNTESVGDHAFALMLSLVRNVVSMDNAVRAGQWDECRVTRPLVTDKTLGILGMGRIGMGIAERAKGFRMSIAYHNRNQRDDVDYAYHADVVSLAAASDVMIICCPGGEATRHIVNAEVLSALGKDGFLINVGRGSVIDTNVLVEALHNATIAGAAVDVLEGEPVVPQAALDAPNLIISPHVAGRAPESNIAKYETFRRNIDNHFAGTPVVNPIP